MSEQEVTTVVETDDDRRLHYQEYLVRYACRPRPRRVRYAGANRAQAAPGVIAAIDSADVVVLAPSNPVASVLPILNLPGVRAALRARRNSVVAVSPIVTRVAIVDQAETHRAVSRSGLLDTLGVPATATGVAGCYAELCARFVVDPADEAEAGTISTFGVEPVVAPLLLHRDVPPPPLLDAILAPVKSDRFTG